MKAIFFSLGLLFLYYYSVKAQNLITVQNGGEPTFYTKLDSAVIHAQNGDTLYLSGGPFSVNGGTLTINKELHIVGAGHNPIESEATYKTEIFSDIVLDIGSNYSTFQGFILSGYIHTGTASGENIDDILISRCRLNAIYLSGLSNNWSILENVISSVIGHNVSNDNPRAEGNYFSNNIITVSIYRFGYNNVFSNNIFLSTNASLEFIDGCLIQNNVFLNSFTYDFDNLTDCILNNNLFTGYFSPYGNLGNNNILNQPQESIFINQTGHVFDYAHDYHLQTSSPGKNAGTDGTDIGIYGGAFPWKEGSIPFNPHFQTFDISPTSDSTGMINVNIQVKAQDN